MTTRLQKNVKQYFKDNIGIIGALLILCIFLSVFPKTSGSFLTQKNIFNVLRQISSNLFLACGMTMVIILGGIDLSVGSIIALSGCFAAGCVSRYGLPIAVGVLGGVLVGTVVGMFNGVVISKTTIPPFIVTLATMNVAKGLAYVYTGGSPVRVVTKEWQFLGAGYVGGVPTPVILLAVVLVITAIIMNKTKLGRHIYAVGGNKIAAKLSGIPVNKYRIIAGLMAGTFVALAGILVAARNQSAQINGASSFSMPALSAVFIGRSFAGQGKPNAVGTLIGAALVGVLDNGPVMMSVPYYSLNAIKGLVLAIALASAYYSTKED